MVKQHALLVFLLLLALATQISAAPAAPSSAAPMAPDAIYKKYRAAIVRIEVLLRGTSLGVGTGYFISADGQIQTSLHVVRPLISHPGASVEVKLANGKVIRNVEIGNCGDERGVDLCVLKVRSQSPVFFSLNSIEVVPGESIVTIGHPRGLDYSISRGIVSAVRQHPAGWTEVQIDAPISPGNSGGPVLNQYGQVVGTVYQFEREGQNLNFAIATNEAKALSTRDPKRCPFTALPQARTSLREQSKVWAQRLIEKMVQPALVSLSDSKPKIDGLKWTRVPLGDESVLVLLPKSIQACERVEEDQGVHAATCTSSGGELSVTIQQRRRNLPQALVQYRGQRLVTPRPLSIVDRMQSEGAWDEAKSENALFMSRVQPARCQALERGRMVANDQRAPFRIREHGTFENANSICRFETENDAEPGALSASQWIEKGDLFYGVNVWTNDPGKLQFAQALSDLIIASAGRNANVAKSERR